MNARPIPVRDLEAIYRRRDWSAPPRHVRIEPEIPAWELAVMLLVVAAIGAMLAIGGAL